MLLISLFWLIALIMPIGTLLATIILNSKAPFNKEKLTPFECGFDPSSSARIPFSLRFFILAVLFLVFDIEIALLMPAPLFQTLPPLPSLTIFIFMIILILGLLHEWKEQSLEWS